MPNYDPDYTSLGLRLINTGYIPGDPKADTIQVSADKLNANTLLIDGRFQDLDLLSAALQHVVSGSPIFPGVTTSRQLVVQQSLVSQGPVGIDSTLSVSGTASFLSDASFQKAAYFRGSVIIPDIANSDDSSQAANTRWVNRRIKEEITEVGGITEDDLKEYATLDSPKFRGLIEVPTFGFDATPDHRPASLLWVSNYLTEKLKTYITTTGAPTFNTGSKVATPPTEANDERIVNAIWVNNNVATQVQNLSTTFTALATTFNGYVEDLDDLRVEVSDIQDSFKVGVVAMYTGSVVPTGWLEADGALVNQADYPVYYAAIEHTYDATVLPESGQFRLPNWGAEVSRLRTLLSLPTAAVLKAIVYTGEIAVADL